MSSTKAHLSVGEAAEELGISETLARNLFGSGELTAYRYGPRKTVIYKEDIEAFKRSRRVTVSNKRESS